MRLLELVLLLDLVLLLELSLRSRFELCVGGLLTDK